MISMTLPANELNKNSRGYHIPASAEQVRQQKQLRTQHNYQQQQPPRQHSNQQQPQNNYQQQQTTSPKTIINKSIPRSCGAILSNSSSQGCRTISNSNLQPSRPQNNYQQQQQSRPQNNYQQLQVAADNCDVANEDS